jgi:hypothetical protein
MVLKKKKSKDETSIGSKAFYSTTYWIGGGQGEG